MIVGVTGCVSSVADVPAVYDQPASGDTIYILAAGTRDHPLAARGAWSTAAELAADLEAAGFVPAVVLDPAEVPRSSPTVESILPGGECFSHAFLPVLTLGVIPELGCREYGHRFQLRCRGAGPTVAVNARFKVRSYVGWFVWPLALSSNWVHDSQGPPTNRREEVLYLKEQLQEALQGSACAA